MTNFRISKEILDELMMLYPYVDFENFSTQVKATNWEKGMGADDSTFNDRNLYLKNEKGALKFIINKTYCLAVTFLDIKDPFVHKMWEEAFNYGSIDCIPEREQLKKLKELIRNNEGEKAE